ncbi:TraR/DksA family transcriptional regulator [Jatrophihabitans sp.]|uniref:TraR/DksA family transcriptional regulator n=1 Tax=Jatrophihabitans sp. TaxID=1932789 RepID=UPI002BFED840|nr:TraR/DksA C4-type zinc finger protein [Jatrophihabitans sp.]
MRNQSAAGVVTDLTQAELLTFEAALHEQRSFRLEQLAELADGAGARSAPLGSEVAGALEQAARHALAEIDLALDRLRDGRYGQCVDCGGAVGRDRLEVLPAAARCMPCQHRISSGRPPAADTAQRRILRPVR